MNQFALFGPAFRKLDVDLTFWYQSPEERGLRLREAFRAFWMPGRPADHWEHFAAQDWTRIVERLSA
jgi:hypothetical protein